MLWLKILVGRFFRIFKAMQLKTALTAKPSYAVMSGDFHADLGWCCVLVPWVPVLCAEGDWLHCVSHAVLEGSQSRPPPPHHLGGSLQARSVCDTLSCQTQWDIIVIFYFFYWNIFELVLNVYEGVLFFTLKRKIRSECLHTNVRSDWIGYWLLLLVLSLT